MTCVEGFFVFLFLSFVLSPKIYVFSDKLTDLYQLIENTEIEEKTIDNTKNIIIINDEEYEIYMYSADESASNVDKSLSKLYTCINCVFAEWIRGELFKLVKWHWNILPDVFSVYLNKMKKSIKNFDRTQNNVNRFINVLLNFTGIYLSEYDTTLNTDVLRSLLSLSFKVNFINARSSAQPKPIKDKKHYNLYSRLLLFEMNSIQRFLFLNCKLPLSFENKFTGLSFNNDIYPNKKSIHDNIYAFLENIRPLKLESPKACTVKQMTLQYMIPKTFGNIEWTTEYGAVTIKTVIQRIKETFDLDVIFWYQKCVLNTLLKMLITKILDYLQQNSYLSKFSIQVIQEIYSSLSLSSIAIMPTELMNGFSILIEHEEHFYSNKDEVVNIFSNFINSLEIIRLNDYPGPISDEGFENVKTQLNDLKISTLDEFTGYLKIILEDFRCFIRLFEFLSHENVTYHESFLVKSVKTKAFIKKMTKKLSKDHPGAAKLKTKNEQINHRKGCQFFRGLYNFSDSAIKYLYEAQEINESHKEKYLSEIKTNLKTMSKLLTDFIKNYWYIHHFRIVYNVLPLVELSLEVVRESFNVPQRLLMGIMTELNAYSIEFCDTPAYNFLSFGRINKKSSKIYEETKKSMDELKKINTKTFCCEYSYLWYLIRISDETYGVFVKYESVINIYWRGTKTNIINLYNSLKFSVSSPYNLYLLYDIYMKFSLAVLYTEIHKMLDPDVEFIVFKEQYDNCRNSLANRFSIMFSDILILIDKYIRSYTFLMNMNRELIDKLGKQIIIQFKKIGVFLDLALDEKSDSKINSTKDTISTNYDHKMTSSGVKKYDGLRNSTDVAKMLTFMRTVNQYFLECCVSKETMYN